MNKGMLLLVGAGVAACGGAAQVSPTAPATTTTTTNAQIAKAEPREAEPAPAAEPAKAPEPAALEIPAATPSQPDPCEARLWWACVTVALDSKKIEKRETLLLGDPNIEETRSGTTDGRKTVDFTTSSGETLSVILRRKSVNKAEIILKSAKGETVIDRHDGDEFQYVSVIATEKAGKAYVDVRYMH